MTANRNEHFLNSEGNAGDQHQMRKLLYKIIDGVKNLTRREVKTDPRRFNGNLCALRDGNDCVEYSGRRKAGQSTLKASIDLLRSKGI
jgi:hypothetical protein